MTVCRRLAVVLGPLLQWMTLYHSLLSAGRSDTAFLGKIPLEPCPSGGVQTDVPRDPSRVAEGGTVKAPWFDPDDEIVELPKGVDTTDPAQVAPMAGYCNRPVPHPSTVENHYETANVFQTPLEPEVELQDVDAVEYKEEVVEKTDDGKWQELGRWHEWDDATVAPDVVADEPPELGDATYLIGFHDGQDMHDPYTHLGVSAVDTPAGALRDVLARIEGTPLWRPKAYRVEAHQSFPAGDVFTGVGEANSSCAH